MEQGNNRDDFFFSNAHLFLLLLCTKYFKDCDSGDDEKSCKLDDEKPVKRTCADDEFQCKDGRCILVREKSNIFCIKL